MLGSKVPPDTVPYLLFTDHYSAHPSPNARTAMKFPPFLLIVAIKCFCSVDDHSVLLMTELICVQFGI